MTLLPLAVTRMVSARIPTDSAEFELALYTSNRDDKEHLALLHGDVRGSDDLLVRVHSECFTGDVLGSRRCDCGEQLHHSMQIIAEAGRGLVIYLRQEGRGIGLLNKLRAYNLQDNGYDTVDANLALGHQADEREYGVAALIIKDLQIRTIHLLTNNPHKIESLRQLGVRVSDRVPLEGTIHADNAQYLRTKAERMSHLLNTFV
jgi:3,4-dihydroxy 2-butanone 4-phosphate synthase/GTP cyclohydrolase II